MHGNGVFFTLNALYLTTDKEWNYNYQFKQNWANVHDSQSIDEDGTLYSNLKSAYSKIHIRKLTNCYRIKEDIFYSISQLFYKLLAWTLNGKRWVRTSTPDKILTSMPRLSTPIKLAAYIAE